MTIIRGLTNLERWRRHNPRQRIVLGIGNFDGVHLGHQHILQQVRRRANERDIPAWVMIFEPQPKEFFLKGSQRPARLTTFADKVRLILQNNIDSIVCLHFNDALRNMSPDRFITFLLRDLLSVEEVIIGSDFYFGRNHEGNFKRLEEGGSQHGFSVEKTATFTYQDERVSSTRIRKALGEDDFELAHQLLGRPFSISGRVMYGRQLGRTLGFPTANVSLKGKHVPVQGVFAVTIVVEASTKRTFEFGVANVGVRPTIGGQLPILEVYFLNFDENIYGRKIRVTFHHKIRDEIKFDGLEMLTAQIKNDVEVANDYFVSL